jgi:hypothetical protein
MLRMVPLPHFVREEVRRRLILPCACKARGRGTTRSVVEGADNLL